MGYSVPAAVAAKIAAPARTVVAIAGDGEFLMNGQEFATAMQYGAPIIVLVVNNGMYGTIRMHQEREYPGRVSGTELANPDFAAYARAFGGHGERVERTADFAPAFQRARRLRQAGDPGTEDRPRGDHAVGDAVRAARGGAGEKVAPPLSSEEADDGAVAGEAGAAAERARQPVAAEIDHAVAAQADRMLAKCRDRLLAGLVARNRQQAAPGFGPQALDDFEAPGGVGDRLVDRNRLRVRGAAGVFACAMAEAAAQPIRPARKTVARFRSMGSSLPRHGDELLVVLQFALELEEGIVTATLAVRIVAAGVRARLVDRAAPRLGVEEAAHLAEELVLLVAQAAHLLVRRRTW